MNYYGEGKPPVGVPPQQYGGGNPAPGTTTSWYQVNTQAWYPSLMDAPLPHAPLRQFPPSPKYVPQQQHEQQNSGFRAWCCCCCVWYLEDGKRVENI